MFWEKLMFNFEFKLNWLLILLSLREFELSLVFIDYTFISYISLSYDGSSKFENSAELTKLLSRKRNRIQTYYRWLYEGSEGQFIVRD